MSRRSSGVGIAAPAFVLLCALAPLLSTGLRGETMSAVPCAESLPAQRFSRTELFLGLSKPDGALVTDAEFRRFVDVQVTPRFPAGFTVVAASGQFRDVRGAIVREDARVLVVLYPHGDRQSNEGIEAVRAAYRQQYQQESVLRVDAISCASF